MKNICKGAICGFIATIVIYIPIFIPNGEGMIYVALIPFLLSIVVIYMLLRTNAWKVYLLSVLGMVVSFLLCDYICLFVLIPMLRIDGRNWVFGIVLMYSHAISMSCSFVSILIACLRTAINIK